MSEGVLIFIINSSDREDANNADHLGEQSTGTLRNSRGWRHQTSDAQSVPLSAGEAEALVKQRVAQEVLPRLPHDLCLHELAVDHLARDASPLVTCSSHTGAETQNC